MDDMYKQFSINFYNKLKNTVNGKVRCTVNENEDKLNIEINRLGLQYNTSVEKITDIIRDKRRKGHEQFNRDR